MEHRDLVIFSYDFPPSNGGIARLCQEVAVGMQQRFQTVTVLTRKKTGLNIPYNFDKVNIVELPVKRFFCEIAALRFLLKIKNKKNTYILCGVWHPEGIISVLSGIKNIFILGHGTEFLSGTSKFREKIWLPLYCKFILRKSKKVIANSNYTKGLIDKISSLIKSEALPLAVNEKFFIPKFELRPTNGKLNMCTVSRIEQFKGHDFIASSIAALPAELRKNLIWNIGGTGSYLEELKSLVKKLEIESNVIFHGFIKDSELTDFYNKNDLFTLCTREVSNTTSVEGFGLVFLEAQSCGLAVLGTNTGGIPDAIVDNEGGWLIQQDNEDELILKMRQFIIDPLILIQQGEKARLRVVEACTWDLYTEKLSNLMV